MHTSSIVADTPERAALREAVGALVGKYGHDYFADRAGTHTEPTELWRDLGAAGFLGVHLSEAYGGGGGTMSDLAVVIEEVATQGCPLLMMVISPAICGTIIDRHGSHELKQRWLPGIADGSVKMAFAITEPDAGSNSHEITTTAYDEPDGGYRIAGTKYWTSGIDEADAVLVVCRDPRPRPDGRRPLSLFVVPTETPGLSWQPIESALRHPEHQFTVFFDDVRVGPDALIGQRGNGLRQVFAGLNPERITAACISNGIARYALAKATRYASDRSVWRGVPIGAHQGVAHPLAEAYIGTQLSRLMAFRAAELYDQGGDAAEAANMAKFASADSSLRTLDQAMQTHGGNGMSLEYGLADLWFVARMLKTAPVSREMVLNFVAQNVLGLPASY